MMRTTWHAAGMFGAVVAAGLVVSGCGGSSAQRDTGTGTQPEARQDAAPSTNLSRSELRERAIAELVAASRSSNAQVRANALEALAMSPARLRPVLALGLRDSNEGVRSVAATVAGEARQRDQMGAVRALLRDSSPYVRASATYALIAMGDRSVDPTPLGDLATRDSSVRVRAHAVGMLGKIGDESAVPLLRSVAASRMPRAGEGEVRLLRLSVSEALVRLGEEQEIHTLHAALFPSTPDQLESAAIAAQMLGELSSRRSIPELTNLVVYRDTATGQEMPAEIRLSAAQSLGRLGKTDGAFVGLEYVNNPEPLIRAQAARVLGVMRGAEASAALGRLLEDPNPLVRVSAAAGVLESLGG